MQNEKMSAKGIHILSLCDGRSRRAQILSQKIELIRLKRDALFLQFKGTPPANLLREHWEEYGWYMDQLHRRFLVNQIVVENITTTVGRSVLAQRLAGDNTFTGNIAYTALGNDATAETVADTTLGNETYRKALSAGTATTNTAYIETFFTTTEVTGTFEEYGNFIDGSVAADSGELFNRFTEQVIKSSSETLNIQSIVTFNNG